MSKENEPEYLQSLPSQSDDQIWEEIYEEFYEQYDLINSIKLETKEQAIVERRGQSTYSKSVHWEEPALGQSVKSWFQVYYDPRRDENDFQDFLETAKAIAEKIKPQIKSKFMNAEMLRDWGLFCSLSSVIIHEFCNEPYDIRHLKGGVSQSKEQHQRWYSKAFFELKKDGDIRRQTDGRVLDLIKKIIDQGIFKDMHYQKDWFLELLDREKQDLAAVLQQNKLSEIKMRRLISEEDPNLPPTNFEAYRP